MGLRVLVIGIGHNPDAARARARTHTHTRTYIPRRAGVGSFGPGAGWRDSQCTRVTLLLRSLPSRELAFIRSSAIRATRDPLA